MAQENGGQLDSADQRLWATELWLIIGTIVTHAPIVSLSYDVTAAFVDQQSFPSRVAYCEFDQMSSFIEDSRLLTLICVTKYRPRL